MRFGAFLATAAALGLALSGCGHRGEKSRPKTPVMGQRTSILGSSEVVSSDENLAQTPVLVPDPTENADWPQSGGNASKSLGGVVLGDGTKQVWAVQIAGGSPRAKLAAAPVVSGGKLYVIDSQAVIWALDAKTGKTLWQKSVRAADDTGHIEFGGGVSVEGDHVYASTGTGDVVALSAADGKTIWSVRPGGPLRGSPTVAAGNVYVMSQDNQLFALNETDGAVVWQDSGTIQSTGVFGVAAPAAGQGTVIAGYSSGELSAYRYENGRVLWGDALSRTNISTSVSTLTDIDADPVVDRGRVFAIGEGGRMASYELVSGQRLWELNIGGIATPLVAGEWVFVAADRGRLFCISRTGGKVRWIAELGGFRDAKKKSGPIRWYGPLLAGGKLILVSTEGQMAFVNPGDGKILSKRKLGAPSSLPPVAAGGLLYVLTETGRVIAYR
ncbi:MAG: PQQ-binding-like beta-propeller repeat protein [Sphingobium sp.]|nr:PQQ-binding-like beta-propeller repeat protein [Sphingobium sp.]